MAFGRPGIESMGAYEENATFFSSSDVVLRCCRLTEGEMCLRVNFPHANLPENDSK